MAEQILERLFSVFFIIELFHQSFEKFVLQCDMQNNRRKDGLKIVKRVLTF